MTYRTQGSVSTTSSLIYQSYPSRNQMDPEEQPDHWKLQQAATAALSDMVSVPGTGL